MSEEAATVLNLWIQSAVAVAAIGAAIAALVIAHRDRLNAREIAAEDRRASLEQAKLMFDLEALLRLSQNIERAGHSDAATSRDMTAEASALLNLLGPDRLPETWADKRGSTLAEAAEYAGGADVPAYKRHAIEVHLELDRVARQIENLVDRGKTPRT